MTTNELRVFISSTFRDLQAEREHLVKKIFPEIRALCRERGVTFTDVDLRWGITAEEAAHDGVIRVCLDEIDRCRPYFIGILGERYGWVPPRADALHIEDRFPVLSSRLLDGASVTEMEIMHGVLANPSMADHAFFYFRDHDATPSEFIDTDPHAARRLRDLKDRIRHSGFPVLENFRTPSELGDAIERDLRALIDAEFPASAAPSELERQRRAHAAFSASRTRAYVEQPEYRTAFREWLDTATTPLVIAGESGLGKSSLVAYLVDAFREQHPAAFVIEHYVGAAESGGSATAVMRHVVEEIRDRFAIDDPIESKSEELERNFSNWLFRAEHYATQAGVEMLVVIDAVNQLDESGRRLAWLPKKIPAAIRCIVSCTPGESRDRLDGRGWTELAVHPLIDETNRRRIVERYLGEFRKSLTSEQLGRIATDPKAESPLFLRVVAEELRVYGDYVTIDASITRYTNVEHLDGVFAAVLERMEQDYGRDSIGAILGAIGVSRAGLSESELLDLTAISRVDLSRFLLALDYHLVRRDGLLGFFHDYLRRAVETRYLAASDASRSVVASRITSYFERQPVTDRSARELLHQYTTVADTGKLAALLGSIPSFLALFNGPSRYDVVTTWKGLIDSGVDVVRTMRDGLDLYLASEAAPERRILAMGEVGSLLQALSRYRAVEELSRAWQAEAERTGDRNARGRAMHSLGSALMFQTRYDDAMEAFEAAREESLAMGDRSRYANAVGNIGTIHRERGNYDHAMTCFEEQRRIFEERNDRNGYSIAVGHMGIVHMARAEYDRALACYDEQRRISEERGERRGCAVAVGNMGVVYEECGEFDRAMACFEEQRSISDEIGSRTGYAIAVGNLGVLHAGRGEFDDAMACFEVKRSISEELGDRRGYSHALVNMGNVHWERGEYDRALEKLTEADGGARAIGFRALLTHILPTMAETLLDIARANEPAPAYLGRFVPELVAGAGDAWRAPTLRRARACAHECHVISTEIAWPEGLHTSALLLARLDAAEGHVGTALEDLRTMLAETTDDGRRADLHYWLWRLGTGDRGRGIGEENMRDAEMHRNAALQLYTEMYRKCPKFEFKKRLEECRIED